MAKNHETSHFKNAYIELTFPVPWGLIAAKSWGDPCLPPVLMVHGIQDNAGTFDRLMPLLPDSFYYVCLDLPGHGKSSRFPKGMFLDFMLYLSAMRRVILQLKWSRYVYIGHSFGAQLGSYYAALYPEEVTKLVMLDTLSQLTVSNNDYLKFCRDSIKKMLDLEKKLLNSDPPNYSIDEAVRRIMSSRMSPISKEAAEVLSKRSLKENNKNFYYFSTDQRLKFDIKTPTTTDLHLNVITKIECPVLLLITKIYLNYVEQYRKGKTDYKTLKEFENKSNVKIVCISGHHDVHNNEPEVVAPHIHKFLLFPKSAL